MKAIGKAFGVGLLLVLGFAFVGLMLERSPDAVGKKCRDIVAFSAVNVDGWRYINGQCTDQEQQALVREFERRGLSTADLRRSRENTQ
jgi:hypothetical protein